MDSASASPLLSRDGREKGDDAGWLTPDPPSNASWPRRQASRPAALNAARRWPHLLFGIVIGLAMAVPLGWWHHAAGLRGLTDDVDTCAASLANAESRVEAQQASALAWTWRKGQDRGYRKPLRHRKPQLHFRDNLYEDRGYLTGLMFGAWSNQVLCQINTLHLAMLAQRIPVLVAFVASTGHFEGGGSEPVSSQFDLGALGRSTRG